jgi:hypothetical protein
MDQANELARAKWLMLGGVLFLISGCISYGEIAYFLNGHDAEGDVTKVYESRSRRGGVSLTVEYTFREPNGTNRKGMASVPTDWPVPLNNKVAVRYTAGEDGSSRLGGRVHWVGLIMFAVSLGLILVFVIRLLREGAEEPKPRRRTRDRTW